MKYGFIIATLFTIILFETCKTAKKETPKEIVLFDFPDNMKLTDAEKKEFTKKIEKGSVLYQLTCAKCHNSMVGGKSTIPDFSLPQLMDYEMRLQYPAHQEHLKDSDITTEELDMVVLFLRYRKKG